MIGALYLKEIVLIVDIPTQRLVSLVTDINDKQSNQLQDFRNTLRNHKRTEQNLELYGSLDALI